VQPGETLVLSLSGHGLKDDKGFYFAPVGLDPEKHGSHGPTLERGADPPGSGAGEGEGGVGAGGLLPGRAGSHAGKQATGQDLRKGMEEGGNLAICTASSGDRSSYESEDLKHGLFTQAWLEALRGEVPENLRGLYQETARGRMLTLSGRQFILDCRVTEHARKAGVSQRVQFPRLEGSFSPSQPMFVPAAGGT
jgi:hypothetical protein